MKLTKVCVSYLLISWVLASCICLFQGCISGTGLEKRCTLVPDSVGLSYGWEKYRGDDEAWRGFSVGATWELK